MMDIMHVVTKWKHYLWERHFKICTYHVSLKYLLHQKVATLARHLWLVELLGYDYEIKYKKGKENVVAGSLSRISCSDFYALVVSTVSTSIMEEIKKSWEKESSIQATIQGLQVSSNSHPYYIWVNNHLNRKEKVVVGNDSDMQNKLISMYHIVQL